MTPQQSLQLLNLDPAVTTKWIAQLNERHRHYHTLTHIESMLDQLPEEYATMEMVAAIWLHDIIYDPKASDNEEQSAHQAMVDLQDTLIDGGFVARLIKGSKHHERGGPEQNVLNDLDLAILGQSQDAYETYARNIRLEYAHVPMADYAPNRALFMRHFLQQPAIYQTAPFTSLERTARENVLREIEALEAFKP